MRVKWRNQQRNRNPGSRRPQRIVWTNEWTEYEKRYLIELLKQYGKNIRVLVSHMGDGFTSNKIQRMVSLMKVKLNGGLMEDDEDLKLILNSDARTGYAPDGMKNLIKSQTLDMSP